MTGVGAAAEHRLTAEDPCAPDAVHTADQFVTQPHLEEIAEDVEGAGLDRIVAQKLREQGRDLRSFVAEMQVGDEQGICHGIGVVSAIVRLSGRPQRRRWWPFR